MTNADDAPKSALSEINERVAVFSDLQKTAQRSMAHQLWVVAPEINSKAVDGDDPTYMSIAAMLILGLSDIHQIGFVELDKDA